MKFLKYIAISVLILTSCSEDVKKFEFAGGTFKMCLKELPGEYDPHQINDVVSATVAYQVFEGLVCMNPEDLKIKPLLAKSWKVSSDKLSYEFTLRENVLFHKCEELNSTTERTFNIDDAIYSFESACKKDENGDPSLAFLTLFGETVKGAKDYFKGKSKKIAGIYEKDGKLIIELAKPDANFLSKLANVGAFITSKKLEGVVRKDLMIGTGPFYFDNILEGEYPKLTLKRNEEYYLKDSKGNQLPYLDAIEFTIESRKLEELSRFENGEINFISSLPPSRISQMLEGKIKDFNSVPPKLILRNNPLLATNFYFFDMTDKRFKDVRVRKAFNYAINKNKITQYVLRGQAYENGTYGMTPPISSTFISYDFKGVKQEGYDYNPELAKKLLEEAGFPEGKGFGSVDLRINIGDINSAVAEEISTQFRQTLGINVNIDAASFDIHNSDASLSKGDLFRSAWFADYVSPESFLINFYGKIVPKSKNEPSVINQSRYQNPKFDEYYEKGQQAAKFKESMYYFSLADMELMKDPPLMVLYYNGDIQLLDATVRNFHENPLNYFIFKEVYFKKWTKQEYENRLK